MNICILGAGAMGSLFGGLLAEAGASVTLLDVNQQQLDAIRRDGLLLETDTGVRRVTTLSALRPEEARSIPDLLLLFTKTHQIRAALGGARHLLGPATWVLTLQNGLGNVEAISEFVPRDRILAGVATIPADFRGPGSVCSHGGGQIRIGAVDSGSAPGKGHAPHSGPHSEDAGCMLSQVVALLNRASLNTTADPCVWAAIWEKVAFNAAFNALCTVIGCTVEQIELVPAGPQLALDVVAEVISVANAAGIPADRARTSDMLLRSFRTHAGHQPSMLQDVLAGRRTEIESINGAVVAEARKHGISVPRTEMLCTLVRLIEASRGLA